jgi:pimeloyl-ACP methyl ester carboxylesterase
MILKDRPLTLQEIKEIIFNTPGFFLAGSRECKQTIIPPDRLKLLLWGNPQENEYIDTAGTRIAYTKKGNGDCIVFLHGMRDCRHVLNPLMMKLADNYSTVGVDLRGHGYSEMSSGGYSTQLFANDIIRLIKSLDREKVHLIGHSLGGALVLEIAREIPDKIGKLVVMGAAIKEEGVDYKPTNPEMMLKDKDPVRHGKFLDMLDKKFFGLPGLDKAKAEVTREKIMLTWMMHHEKNVLDLMKMKRTDLASKAKQIPHPVLAIAGEFDVVGNPTQTAFLKNNLPNCRTELIKDTGHYMFLDFTDQVAKHIKDFIN